MPHTPPMIYDVLATALICLLAIMSPGPNFVAVTHRAVSAPRAEAMALVVGIACISGFWAGAALFGLGVVFRLFPWVFWTVKLLGAAYLGWFGLTLLRHAGRPLPARALSSARGSSLRAFRDGVVTNLSNPKAMVFYASVFAGAVPAGASTGTLVAMVSMVPVIALGWYGLVALLLSSEQASLVYRRLKPWLERGCGLLLLLFAVRQATP